jgi:glycosyltransferase involved in cell wall biosynthesis
VTTALPRPDAAGPDIATALAALSPPPAASPAPQAPPLELGEIAERAALRRIHILAWRDLDDPEAGGSEIHAAKIAGLWAAAGIDVTMRTSTASGHPALSTRDGYRVIRKAGRYAVFPRTALSGLVGRTGKRDGLVEVWNGMPFFSPLWCRDPSIVFLHHVHAEMWRMVIKQRALARAGEMIEFRLAPPFYRNAQVVTLSSSSRDEIVELLGLPAANITVVPPGVDPRFRPGTHKSSDPLIVAVGRLVPVKRFDLLIDALVAVRRDHPRLRAVIAGEGYERRSLESQVAHAGATDWISLPGRVDDDSLVALYQNAWIVASTSGREGWGMTLTEAAACGTPSVVTDIAGHRDAVLDGTSGLVAPAGDASDPTGVAAAIHRVLSDDRLRTDLSAGALAHASTFTWQATARGTLEALAARATSRRSRTGK